MFPEVLYAEDLGDEEVELFCGFPYEISKKIVSFF
jgi:hypothetical protein